MANKESVEFEITLDDESVEAAAKGGAEGLTKLEKSIKATQAQYSALGKQMKDLQKGSSVDIELMRKLQTQHKAAGERVASLTSRTIAYKTELTKHNRETAAAQGWVSRLKTGLASLSKEGVEKTSVGVQGLVGKMALANVISSAVISVWTTLTSTAMGLAKSIFQLAVSNQDARRSELIHLEAMSKLYSVWGIVREKGATVQRMIDNIAQSSASSRADIAGFAEGLQKMGFRGDNLSRTLEAMGIIAATQGKEYADRFATMAQTTVYFEGSVKRMTDDVKARLGGLAKREALGLSTQLHHLQDNIASLFRGVNIGPFLEGLHKVLALFSLSSSSGRALQQIFSGLFTVVFGQADKAATSIHGWIQDTIIKMQDLILRLLKMGDKGAGTLKKILVGWVVGIAKDMWAFAEPYMIRGIDLLMTKIAPVLGRAVAPLAGAFALGLGKWIVYGLLTIGTNIGLALISGLLIAADLAVKVVGAVFRALGFNVAAGIAAGISDGIINVIDAVMRLGGAIKARFASVLWIRSPSFVMRKSARFVPSGVALGIRDGIPQVRAATTAMAAVPASVPMSMPAGGGGMFGGRGGGSLTIDKLIVNTSGSDAKSIAQDIKSELERILEGVAIQMGATG